MSKLYVAKEEPEFMRKWKEEQKERLEKKDQEETAAMEELKVKAKQELEDWYKRYETQLEKTKNCNREEETKYEGNEMNHIEPGSEWERVAKHCDFSAKVDLAHLSHLPPTDTVIFPGTRPHEGRLQAEVHHVAVEAESDRSGVTRLQLRPSE